MSFGLVFSIRVVFQAGLLVALALPASVRAAEMKPNPEKYWAFQTPARPALPPVREKSWPKNSIDYFVLARLEKEGWPPAPAAPKETLIRRVTLDLTGLPPTLAEIDAFISDRSPDAYEKLVDRLLASTAYGEQMAAAWLDEARFADSNGYQNDFHRSMWPWRDWVIHAFNANMPYDQFVVEQLAGDLLPHPTRDQIVATGFNRNNRTVTEAGSIDEEWRVENTVDRVETTSAVFLGLTMGCARCHDHKFDPISQKEFYQFYAFFNSLNEQGVYTETRGNMPPLLSLPTPKQEQKLQQLDAEVLSAEKSAKELESQLPAAQAKWEQDQLAKDVGTDPADGLLRFQWDGGADAGDHTPALQFKGEGKLAPVETPFGKAVQLDGKANSFFSAGDAAAFERTDAFSYGGWIKPKGSGAVLSRMNEADNFRGFDLLVLPDRRLSVHIIHHWETNAIRVITSNAVPAAVWSHVVVSYDGSSQAKGIHIYVDGKPVPFQITHDSLAGSITTGEPLRIGRRSQNLPFDGALADIRVYRRALSELEAAAWMDRSLRPFLETKADARPAPASKELAEFFKRKLAPEFQHAEEALAAVRTRKQEFQKQIPTVMVMEDRKEPRETFILKRGQYDQPDKTQKVEPGVPAALTPFPAGAPRNRLGLAEWIVAPENPLTARVAVSRFWQRYFGMGLVKTSENFGSQGDRPSHPELLDWLATEFIRSGWNMKAIQKLIVMSATYQQSSAVARELFERDPDNRLLSHGPRFRLPAEMLRDNALAAGGLLFDRMGGPSIKPYQPQGLWTELAGGANEGPYQVDKAPDLYRRSLYIFRKRTVPPPTMSTFDAPSRETCQVKRQRTNTPLQALAMLNDVTYLEAARALAQSMLGQGGSQPGDRICFGFRRATARWPLPRELERLKKSFEDYRTSFQADPAAAAQLIHHGDLPPDAKTPAAELAAYTTIASVILNLDETITKE